MYLLVSSVINLYDPFNKRSDPSSVVFILGNKYVINRSAGYLESDEIDQMVGTVTKRVRFSVNENGEANYLNKGTELYSIKNADTSERIAVLFEGKYEEYIDAPWD